VKEIVEKDSIFSGTLITATNRIDSLMTSVDTLTTSYTTILTNMASLKTMLDAQSNALAQVQ
jgi:hypothetical protein